MSTTREQMQPSRRNDMAYNGKALQRGLKSIEHTQEPPHAPNTTEMKQ